jgi:hypothetical protein
MEYIFKIELKFLFVIFILFGFQYHSFAQDGCHVVAGSQDRPYYTSYAAGNGSPTEWISTSAGRGGYNLITSAVCFDDSSTTCVVYKFGTTGANPPLTQILYSGFYAQIVGCSLDDYVLVLLIFTIGIVYFKIKSNHPFIINESYNHHGSF